MYLDSSELTSGRLHTCSLLFVTGPANFCSRDVTLYRDILRCINERFSRCCLTCFAQNGKRVLDSEWHAIFDCPSHAAARGRFTLATKFLRESDSESTVTDLCHIVTYTRSCASRLGELAKFLLNIRLTRRRNHRHLTSNGPNGRVRLLRRLVWDSWRNALTLEH